MQQFIVMILIRRLIRLSYFIFRIQFIIAYDSHNIHYTLDKELGQDRFNLLSPSELILNSIAYDGQVYANILENWRSGIPSKADQYTNGTTHITPIQGNTNTGQYKQLPFKL